jgi:cellulose synthase operon protein C
MRGVPVAWLLGGVALVPAAAQTQPLGAEAPVAASAAARPVDILIRQAERWLAMERLDLAASSIERALVAEPRNTQALAMAARIEAARGNRTGAAAITTRLREAGGTEEQRAAAETAVRAASIDRNAIEEARRLARDGRTEEAATRYRQIFGAAGPPPAYQQEYFSVLAGTQRAGDEGRRGLERLAESPSATPRARLNFAQTQTFQPATRQDGIRRLQALVGDPEVGEEARRAWRQALTWSAADPAYAGALQSYLQRYPQDAELRQAQQAALAAAPRPDPGATLRQEGFQRLEAGGAAGLRDSARQFEAALAANPRDADALGGLGIVRLRENRPAEARQLLERAVAADPSRATQWQSALDGAAYGLELAEARTALRRNDVDAADTIARSAARRQVEDRTDVEVLLGQVALRRGDAAAAEQRFRTALSRRPGFAPARDGLAQALRAQGRLAELPRIAEARPLPGDRGGPAPSSGPVNALRAEAARTTDPFVAEALLRQAMTTAPNDPWLRLDLARALRRQGQLVQARGVLEEQVVSDPRPDSLFAAALFADEEGRIADADNFLNRIPPASRSPDMSRLQARIRTQRDVQRAAQGLGRTTADARVQLLTIAARPDPTGGTAAAVIRAFGDANDRFGAAEAARVGEAANRMAGPQARLAIAGALLGAGLEGEAAALADQLDNTGTLTAEQRRDVASLRAGIAVRASDRLNTEGNQAQAFERLRPTLERDPENTDANLALARLFQGAREPREAQRIAEAMLARNPRNFDARQGAIDAAIALRQRARAEALLAEGQELFPRESRMTLLEARVALAFNQEDRARRALETASAQRRAELGTAAGVPAGLAMGPGGQPNPFLRPGAAVPLPVIAGGTQQPTDRLTREIAQEMAALEERTAPRASLAGNLRQRSGSSGVDRLLDLRAPVEAEFTPPVIGGRVTANVTAVSLDSGTLGTDSATQRRFGSGSLVNAIQNPRSTAAGVGLGITYRRGDAFRFDIGSSPLGFPTTTLLGGIEVAPQIGSARIRLTGERRSVEDSLLSWAGQRDQFNGRNWGNVVRTGGRGQVELPLGPGYIYAGGGYSVFEGQNVASNARIEAGAGFSYPVIQGPNGELSVGSDIVYFAYDRNQSHFTYGSGGYFSPQSYTAFNVPVDFRGRSGDFRYRLGATAGYAVFRQEATPVFANDPALQRQLVARAAALNPTAITPLLTAFPSQNQQNFVGGLRADLDYAITPRINLGAGFRYDKAADWDETRVFLRLQSRF